MLETALREVRRGPCIGSEVRSLLLSLNVPESPKDIFIFRENSFLILRYIITSREMN